jgi:hypothetical protein
VAILGEASGVFTLGEEGPDTGVLGNVVGRGGRRTGVPGGEILVLAVVSSVEAKDPVIGSDGGETKEDMPELLEAWLPKLIPLDDAEEDAAEVEPGPVLGGG